MVDIMNLESFDWFDIMNVVALWNILVQLLTMDLFKFLLLLFSHIEFEEHIYASVE